ncbi:MAG TPA: hypothetical protein VGB90_00920 [Alphaproteobacteria bacterium]|jgi:hypothetical protein
MTDYDSSDFRITAKRVVAAWLAAAIFLLITATAVPLLDGNGRTPQDATNVGMLQD